MCVRKGQNDPFARWDGEGDNTALTSLNLVMHALLYMMFPREVTQDSNARDCPSPHSRSTVLFYEDISPRTRHTCVLATCHLGSPLNGTVPAALPVIAGSGWLQSGSAPPTYASGLSQSAPG